MTILHFTGQYEREPLEEALAAALGGGYVVERELIGGGMSRVFVAHELALARRVAIKVLAPDLSASVSVERFRREILTAAGLQHPHIVGVLSTGEVGGLPYFIMPFVEGESLRMRVRGGPMAVRDVVHILRDVARALEFAHGRGVVHRDIKPDNILLAGGVAMVTDFGVAKAITVAQASGGARHQTITVNGTSLGTPAYMSPEQIAADPATDLRADLYSLGVTGYEMLAGALPFVGENPQALLSAQLTAEPPPLASRRADVPEALERLVRQCMAKHPDGRPASASAVLALLEDPATLSGDFAVPPRLAPRAITRRRLLGAAVGAIAVGAMGVAAWRRLAQSAVPVDPHSILVLDIVDLSEDSSASGGARALTAEVRSALGHLPAVKVAAPAARATASIADDAESSQDAGRRAHVAAVLESTLQRDGTRLRLAVRLVNTSDGLASWSEVFEGEAKSLFDVQRQLTDALVGAIGGVLAARPPSAGPSPR